MCPRGFYADVFGSMSCKPCPQSMTTVEQGARSFSTCVCGANFYRTDSTPTKCAKCPDGMTCEIGSDTANLPGGDANCSGITCTFPKANPGFMTLVEKPLFPYECKPSRGCPGGPPGVCLGSPQGIACAMCPIGMKESAGDTCEPCNTLQKTLGWIAVLGILPGSIVGYYSLAGRITPKATALLSTTCMFGMLLSMLQTFGIFMLLSIPWPELVKDLLRFTQIFMLDFSMLSLDCALSDNSSLMRYSASVFSWPLVVLSLGVCKAASHLVF